MGGIVRAAAPPAVEASRRRLLLAYVLPTVALLALAVWPLVAGARTLYLRDVLNVHFGMKWYQAQAMRDGRLPLVDPTHAGGQAHLGNPNTVPLYPDNVLYLVADAFWALNAHFWLHLLLAPLGGYLLGRGWGLRREAAWAVGVCFAASGYYLSHLNLYNALAPATLAPALVGAALRLGDGGRRRWLAATAALWALIVLGGDPVTAVIAFALAASAAACRHGRRYPWGRGAVAAACGTLLAAPQWIELWRILALSYRGHLGYPEQAALVASFHPLAILDLVLVFPFGRPDLLYWGRSLHSGQLPLLLSLYSGALSLALVAIAPRRGRAVGWAWSAVLLGGGAALGSFNPVMRWLLALPGAGLFRLPIKFWLAVALGASLLCGLAVESLFAEAGRRRLRQALLALVLGYLVAWAGLTLLPGPVEGLLRRAVPRGFTDVFVVAERVRWAGTVLLTLGVLVLLLAATSLRPRWRAAVPVALAVHLATQLFLLRPLLATDEVDVYRRRPALADQVPAGSRVTFGDYGIFGSPAQRYAEMPDLRVLWTERALHAGLHPWSGVRWGLRYEWDITPEGLQPFLTQITYQTLLQRSDAERLRMVRASGVEYLVLSRDLDEAARAAVAVEEIARQEVTAATLRLYRLVDPVAPVVLAGEVRGAESLNEAAESLFAGDFDPTRQAIVAGTLAPRSGPPGTTRLVAEEDESLLIEVDSEAGGALVVQRTFLPLYKATVDGAPARLVAANLHRLALVLEPGRHEVRIWVDRRSLALGAALALMGAAGLAVACRLLGSPASP